MNRIDRLTGMILLLQGQRVITAEQMAAHFEISLRTVYRDISALGEAGVPIVSEAGVGYSLMRGYHIPPVMFTEDEAAALFFSGEISDQIADESLRLALRSALLKVRSVLPKDRQDYVNRLKNVVRVRLASLGPNDAEDEHGLLMPLQQAVVRRQCVALKYDAGARGEISARTVEPLGILFYGQQWHLVGWCRLRQDYRDFRMDRVVSWTLSPEVFSGREDFSLKSFLAERISKRELIAITAVFSAGLMSWVQQGWPKAHITEEPLPDGRVRVEMLAWSMRGLANWLLSFGTGVEVLQPPELRQEVQIEAAAIAARHALPVSDR